MTAPTNNLPDDVIGATPSDLPPASAAQSFINVGERFSLSPWGEGRGEGAGFTFRRVLR